MMDNVVDVEVYDNGAVVEVAAVVEVDTLEVAVRVVFVPAVSVREDAGSREVSVRVAFARAFHPADAARDAHPAYRGAGWVSHPVVCSGAGWDDRVSRHLKDDPLFPAFLKSH